MERSFLSRDLGTQQEEPEIDPAATHASLVEMGKSIRAVQEKDTRFCGNCACWAALGVLRRHQFS